MAFASREQAASLLSAAKNHADLAVKVSSLKQAKEILLSLDPSVAADLFPYIVELQKSPESFVRKCLVELIEELGLKMMGHSYILMPVLLALLKDESPVIVRQSVICGTNFFCSILEEMSIQFCQTGKVERWLEDLWSWMIKFKDAVVGITTEPGSVGSKLQALKFLEIYILVFTSDAIDSEEPFREGRGRNFNISWVVGGHPILDSAALTTEANRVLGLLLDLLRSANVLRGSLIVVIINCLAAIARKRPLHFSSILSALLGFDANLETLRGGHAASIQYALRVAYLGFLRCTHPSIMESRERLLRALRGMNVGDAADQVIRQVDKMLKNTERAVRDVRVTKEDLASQGPISGDLIRKKSIAQDNEGPANTDDPPSKRIRFSPVVALAQPAQLANDFSHDDVATNEVSSSKMQLLDSDLTPVEQMIMMIGALLAEGERGAESLEILISKIHPDLLADIVIANMKHLPKNPPPLASRLGNFPANSQGSLSGTSTPMVAPSAAAAPAQSSGFTSHVGSPLSSASGISMSTSDVLTTPNLPADSKRDPRRDPRRLDPRRAPEPVGVQLSSTKLEDASDIQSGFDGSNSLNRPLSVPIVAKVEHTSTSLTPKSDTEHVEVSTTPFSDTPTSKENLEILKEANEAVPASEVHVPSEAATSPVQVADEGLAVASTSSDVMLMDGNDSSSVPESDQYSSAVSSTSEELSPDLPLLPLFVELTNEQQNSLSKLAIARIIEAHGQIQATGSSNACLVLLSRLVAQTDVDDDIILMLQKHIVLDYQYKKGHELAMCVLYHLHAVMISESDEHSSSFAATIYEKFLLAVAKSLRDTLPASDKSFSRLLGEVPLLPDSALKLLEELCYSEGFDMHEKDVRDVDRVTQGLGAVWSLILGRAPNRQACLNIALKCAVHSQDDVRAKAIRLVANKLYPLAYVAENIEQFATNKFLSVADQRAPDVEKTPVGSKEPSSETYVGNPETSISGSQSSEPAASESDSVKGVQQALQSAATMSLSQAQRNMSLFFALCTKKPSLLQLVFDIYGRAPKAVKQAIHRHVPILVRTLEPSYSELLHIVSDPPQGSENLLMLVLQILTGETTPSADLIATVKHLYETKLKDAAILIPLLSSLSKEEVLPIFPRLVDLPLEKFQSALAHILQGSAHTGPALTPAEVLVAIHDINPEKDGIALKKITDACTACFEQRTVFTQQVLVKALNHLVDQTPLPLLFMRTVIQAIDAFPVLVDFVMEILSKLVNKQIWKMPKLWVGFLKCAAQTQPHSFRVLLKLPPAQLENALNKYANLRGPLSAHANQSNIRTTLPRLTLVVLGLLNESQTARSYMSTAMHPSDTSSSVHGATLT